MKNFLAQFGFRFTTGHLLWAAVLIPACIAIFIPLNLLWVGITLSVLIAIATVLTVRGRRLTGWIAAIFAWRRRHKTAPGRSVDARRGRHRDAGRSRGGAVAGRLPGFGDRADSAAVHPDGHRVGRGLHRRRRRHQARRTLIAAHCPDLEADVVSAGYRVGKTAPSSLVALYEQVVGPYPAPANRRTWIVLRAMPEETRKPAQRREAGVGGLARYLVASTTRIADQLSSNGIDARCGRSFDDFDHATEISFEREAWSSIKGRSTFTAAYTAPGGPDVWWSARADHTITRVRIHPGTAPTTTVLLTTLANPSTPRGFSCLFGGQRAAVLGQSPLTDRHYELPIGSAGVLVGETADRYPVYMPFDDVDVSINLGDARLFTQFVVRSAAAGAVVTLGPQFREFAGFINARIGQVAKVAWPNATTYLGPHPGVGRVVLRTNFIDTPRHRQLPIRLINPREESRYQMALEQ